MVAREAQLKNFFQNIEVATRGVEQTTSVARWTVGVSCHDGQGQASTSLLQHPVCPASTLP
jgi:hypothetical protein